jgi:hypothetical protein
LVDRNLLLLSRNGGKFFNEIRRTTRKLYEDDKDQIKGLLGASRFEELESAILELHRVEPTATEGGSSANGSLEIPRS